MASAAPAALPESTLDPRLQAIADEELDRAMGEWNAEAGVVLVLDPFTGRILADAGRAHGAKAEVAADSEYLAGSPLKALTLAAALEDGVVTPTERFDCENGKWSYDGKTVEDHRPSGVIGLPEMLAVSSNIGFAKVFDRLGTARLNHWMGAFHLATALPDPLADHSFQGAEAAIGTVKATPLQVAAAYAVLANDGTYVAPTRVSSTGASSGEALVRPETARTVAGMLESSVNDANSTGALARIDGQRVAGKTGTATWDRADGSKGIYASFVGFVASTPSRLVILVGIEQPRGQASGGKVAAPVFARVATRALRAL